MKIYSLYSEKDTFQKLRRLRWRPFAFLVKGEWSQGPYHEGTLIFDYALSPKGDRVALLHRSVPRRIVCIAILDEGDRVEDVLGHVMFHLYANGGEHIEIPWDQTYDEGEPDFDLVWNTFRKMLRLRRLGVEDPEQLKSDRDYTPEDGRIEYPKGGVGPEGFGEHSKKVFHKLINLPDKVLVEVYNRHFKNKVRPHFYIGTLRRLDIFAMHQVFMERFGTSPFSDGDSIRVYSLKHAELKNGQVYFLEPESGN